LDYSDSSIGNGRSLLTEMRLRCATSFSVFVTEAWHNNRLITGRISQTSIPYFIEKKIFNMYRCDYVVKVFQKPFTRLVNLRKNLTSLAFVRVE